MSNIPYGKQYIDQEDINAVVDVLKSDWLTQGPKTSEFEREVANYHGCKYAVAFSNGTAALHGAYYVSTKLPFGKRGSIIEDVNSFLCWGKPKIKDYDRFRNQYWEFITTPITFVASANGGLYCNGSPKFVDINMSTYCIDIEKIEDAITDDTRVVTPVSYSGYPIDIKAIKELPKVKENNICIIHDACHAMGAIREGHGIADFSDMTILSFHPVKNITTGEGGMVLTNNKKYYEELLLFRNHGIVKNKEAFVRADDGTWYYEMQQLGYNYRMTDMQSALGISQMKKVDKFLYKRNEIAKAYEVELSKFDWITLPPGFEKGWIGNEAYSELKIKPKFLHSYHLYPILLDKKIDRRNLFDYMRDNNVGVQVHYVPINFQPIYQNNSCNIKLENSEAFYNSIISFPNYYLMSSQDLDFILDKVLTYAKRL